MSDEYWDKRAACEYNYKGEKFYTMTAIPYYYERRNEIIKKIKSIICNGMSVCDFGCGDGVYIREFAKTYSFCSFHGVDISEQMIERAEKNTKKLNTSFEVSGEGIMLNKKFDVIYSSAVFAHIDDNTVSDLFYNISKHVSSGGVFVLCEQTAPYRYSGKGFIRRTLDEYNSLLISRGLKPVNAKIIDFWFHRIIFERVISKLFIKYYKKKYKIYDKETIMIKLNNNKYYRGISWICTKLSIPHVFNAANRWGYCIIVAKK